LLGTEAREETAAEELFRQTLALSPLHGDGLHGLADLLLRTGRASECEQLLQRQEFLVWDDDARSDRVTMVNLEPTPSHAVPLERLAELKLRRGEADVAKRLCEMALLCDPQSASASVRMAEAQRVDGNMREALKLFEAAASLDPRHDSALIGLAETMEELGMPDAAIKRAYQRACQFREVEIAKDTTTFLRDVHRSLTRWQAVSRFAVFLQQRGDDDMSLRMHQRAVELAPDQSEALLGLSWFYLDTVSDTAAAHELLDKAMAAQPSDHSVHRIRGNALYRQGHNRKAKEAFERAVELQPTDAKSLCDLGHLFAVEGQLEEARKRFCAAKGFDPKAADADLALAALYLAAGRDDDAEKFRMRAEATKPGSASVEGVARIAATFTLPAGGEPGGSGRQHHVGKEAGVPKDAAPNPILAQPRGGVTLDESSSSVS